MSRSVTVINPGALSLIQDSGRQGYQRYGVPVSGAIDPEALLIGNLLVGNGHSAAAIEVMFGGAEFLFSAEAVAAVTGCDLEISLDGTRLSTWQSFVAPAGAVLRLGPPVAGLRAYVTVDGGIDIKPVLGSRSTHVASGIGGLDGRPLAAGDELPLGAPNASSSPGAKFPGQLRKVISNELTVRVVQGPQRSSFTSQGVRSLFSSTYTVTDRSDRQGLRLDGPVIEAVDGRYDIISDAVVSGAVQVPGDGRPIILLADRQTTGGYAKIAVVATVDLPLLAQAVPGTALRFVEITVAEAQQLMRERHASVLSADLTFDLETHRSVIAIDGETREINLDYRRDELRKPGGGAVSVSIEGVRSTVRVEEMPR
ncbi:MAG: biotin-dependent carboxyltransferase family protein [Chloroflexi bacterium]|nr:biotin-dependent carboxyltransferase family protein [Chloroflexota bacterium]